LTAGTGGGGKALPGPLAAIRGLTSKEREREGEGGREREQERGRTRREGGKEGRGRDWCPHMTFLHDAPESSPVAGSQVADWCWSTGASTPLPDSHDATSPSPFHFPSALSPFNGNPGV